MHIRFALLAAVLCGASYSCATAPDESAAAAPASAPQPRQEGSYRTGSRLPSYEGGGASSVGDVSKDDYADERRRGVNPASGR